MPVCGSPTQDAADAPERQGSSSQQESQQHAPAPPPQRRAESFHPTRALARRLDSIGSMLGLDDHHHSTGSASPDQFEGAQPHGGSSTATTPASAHPQREAQRSETEDASAKVPGYFPHCEEVEAVRAKLAGTEVKDKDAASQKRGGDHHELEGRPVPHIGASGAREEEKHDADPKILPGPVVTSPQEADIPTPPNASEYFVRGAQK
jgi:hypothetical protein